MRFVFVTAALIAASPIAASDARPLQFIKAAEPLDVERPQSHVTYVQVTRDAQTPSMALSNFHASAGSSILIALISIALLAQAQ